MSTQGGYIEPGMPSTGGGYKDRAEKREQERLRRSYMVHTVLFCSVLFYFGVLSLMLPKAQRSEVEKRELAKMPEFSTEALVEGTYTRDLELHYADTFPFREFFVTVAAKIDELRGIRFDGVRIHMGVQPEGAPSPSQPDTDAQPPEPPPEPSQPAAPAAQEPDDRGQLQQSAEEAAPVPVADDGAVGEQQGAVFVYKDKAMSIFGGGTASAERYAGVITAYKQAWGDEVNVYNIVVPTAIEFALPERYAGVSQPQLPNIQHIYKSLGPGVIPVDAYGAIQAHADEYVYFSSDHHWTALGAYYVYRQYASSAGFQPLELDQFEHRTITDFHGTMHAQTNDAKLAADQVDYYLPQVGHTAIRLDRDQPFWEKPHSIWAEYAKGVNAYSVFLHGDFPLIRADTENKNGRRVLVVKESFGNAFAPWLVSHYEQVHIVDQRYFQLSLPEYVRDHGIQDVVFINNIFAANTKYHIDNIEGMMQYRLPAPEQEEEPEGEEAELAEEEPQAGEAEPAPGRREPPERQKD